MRWREVRLLLLVVLIGSLAYNSWKSHSLVHIIWAPLSARLSPVLPGATKAQPAPLQATILPEQLSASGNARIKAVKIKVRRGPASDNQGKIRVAVSKREGNAVSLADRVAALPSSNAADSAEKQGLDIGRENGNAGSRTAGQSGFSGTRQSVPDSLAIDGNAPQDQARSQGAQVFLQQDGQGSANTSTSFVVAASQIPQGFDLAKQAAKDAPTAAAVVPLAPKGQSCESWLTKADARVYQRDFQRQPVTVLEGYGLDNELAGCAVPCRMAGGTLVQAGEEPISYDAHFGQGGESGFGMGLSVLRNMESMTNYPGLAVERAHADGYDIVMTTRLDSDVPASYLSWAEYLVMKPLAPKQADVVAFISNCGAKSFRLQALQALSTNFTVHSYGRCLRNNDTAEAKADVLQRYRFTLAFENSQELDYVTEKYIQALEAGSVPIVIGATNIADYEVAPNSMLVLESMEDVPRVAARMQYMLRNRTAYDEMLAWKRTGPQDKFLALLDLSVVHSSCNLCIHLATRIRAAEEAAQEASRQPPCSCRRGPGGSVVHHVLVRERGRFESRDVFLDGGNLTVAGMHAAIGQAFGRAGHVPIWHSHRPDFKGGAREVGGDEGNAPIELRIYRVYQVGQTQRAALYGEASLDTDLKVAEVVSANPCAKLEVIFV